MVGMIENRIETVEHGLFHMRRKKHFVAAIQFNMSSGTNAFWSVETVLLQEKLSSLLCLQWTPIAVTVEKLWVCKEDHPL